MTVRRRCRLRRPARTAARDQRLHRHLLPADSRHRRLEPDPRSPARPTARATPSPSPRQTASPHRTRLQPLSCRHARARRHSTRRAHRRLSRRGEYAGHRLVHAPDLGRRLDDQRLHRHLLPRRTHRHRRLQPHPHHRPDQRHELHLHRHRDKRRRHGTRLQPLSCSHAVNLQRRRRRRRRGRRRRGVKLARGQHLTVDPDRHRRRDSNLVGFGHEHRRRLPLRGQHNRRARPGAAGRPEESDGNTLYFMAPNVTVTYSCSLSGVTASFTNTLDAYATTGPGPKIYGNAAAAVTVEAPYTPPPPRAASSPAPRQQPPSPSQR